MIDEVTVGEGRVIGIQLTCFLNESFKMTADEHFLPKKGLTQANESVKCIPHSRRGG